MSSSFSFLVVGILVFCIQSAPAQDTESKNPFSEMMINALFDPKVGKELDLVEEQVVEMKSLLSDLQRTRKDLAAELNTLSKTANKSELEEFRKDFQEQFNDQKKETMTKVREVLLPEQLKRLGQLTAQLMLKESAKKSGVGMLAPEMIELLEISEEQQKRLKEKGDELRIRLAEEIKRLTEEAREELMQELTQEQIDKYQKLVGQPIDK